jgi:hypothetical protein
MKLFTYPSQIEVFMNLSYKVKGEWPIVVLDPYSKPFTDSVHRQVMFLIKLEGYAAYLI